MNWTLFKSGMKSSAKPILIFAAVLTMYFTVLITMFDPSLGSALLELEKAMPQLMAMVGMSSADTTLVGFMGSYLYGFIVPIMPMVYAIIMANSLVAKKVDSGSMVYLLAAPVSRRKIVFTQMTVLITGVFLLIAYSAGVGIASCEIFFPSELDISKFLILNLGALALHLLISGICFFFSCLFNDTKYSLAFGAGIPAFAYIIQMMANVGGKLENAKYATFFSFFHPNDLINGKASAYWGLGILAIGGLALYGSGCVIFAKKDIPV